jgi:hypothetical protein
MIVTSQEAEVLKPEGDDSAFLDLVPPHPEKVQAKTHT